MKIIRNIIAVSLALCMLSGLSRKADSAAAAEQSIHICDHRACEAALAEARKSFDLILRIEIEIIPGVFGDWAVIEVRSDAIEISADAAEGLELGMDLAQNLSGSSGFIENLIDCRIIVESIIPNV